VGAADAGFFDQDGGERRWSRNTVGGDKKKDRERENQGKVEVSRGRKKSDQ